MRTLDMIAAIRGAVDDLDRSLDSTAGKMRAVRDEAAATSERVRDARDSIEESASGIEDATRRTQDAADRALGDLKHYVEQSHGQLTPELEYQLSLLESGGQSLQTFLGTWGDAVVQTEEGGKRIREILEGIDPRAWEDRTRGITEALRQGEADISDALEHLRQTGGELTSAFTEAVEAMRQGRGTVERVLALAQQLREVLGDSSLADLADQIARGLGPRGVA